MSLCLLFQVRVSHEMCGKYLALFERVLGRVEREFGWRLLISTQSSSGGGWCFKNLWRVADVHSVASLGQCRGWREYVELGQVVQSQKVERLIDIPYSAPGEAGVAATPEPDFFTEDLLVYADKKPYCPSHEACLADFTAIPGRAERCGDCGHLEVLRKRSCLESAR